MSVDRRRRHQQPIAHAWVEIHIEPGLVTDPQPTNRPNCGEMQEAFPLVLAKLKWPDRLHPTAVGLLA